MRSNGAGAVIKLEALANKQLGLITHAQALEAGLGRFALSRLVRAGAWKRVLPRVFLRAGFHESAEERIAAACLWLGGSALASHRSAANLWGLQVDVVGAEVSTRLADSRTAPGVVVHRSADLAVEDRRMRRGIPVTSPARTIIDLASCLGEDALAYVVEEAWRRQLAAPDWVERRLQKLGGRGRPGAKRLAGLLADCRRRERPLESALEVRLWRLLLRSKLPLPEPGFPFRDDYGQPGRIDFAYPAQRLAIEADGFEFHGTRAAFERDRLRTARLSALGWRVLPVTWKHLDDQPAKVVERIRQALEFRA